MFSETLTLALGTLVGVLPLLVWARRLERAQRRR